VSDWPTVSVLLPVRDGASTIRGAVDSVLAQTFSDFEILVLDDGSRDGSPALASSIGDPRIRVFEDGVRLGLALRLNRGIDLARGRYIARMDADDLCFPERLARQVRYLEDHPETDLVGCRAVVFRHGGDLVGLFPFAASHEQICARPWNGFHLAHPTWMGRTNWFRRYRYREPECARAEDQELLLRSFRESRFACLPEVLVAYRQGAFGLRRTWRGRRSFLAAQVRHFSSSGEPLAIISAAGAALVKAGVDLVAALPGCDRLFFKRMAEPLPEDVRRQAEALRNQYDLGV
jgi:glycosyltransferase involved in cell wall biosynthesis